MNPVGRHPAPHDVFTPGSPPLEEHNIYVSRTAAEHSLRKYIQRRQVPVVWGEYGVGKTTLVQRFFQEKSAKGTVVYIASVSGLTLPDIFRTILEHLEYTVTVESTTTDVVGVDGGFDLRIVKANAKGETANSLRTQLVITSPTDTGINNIIREAGLTVVLDEMHKASGGLQAAIADWIKATRAGASGFQLVLVGTSTDAGRLVALDPGIDRYVKEMPVELMSEAEARYIIDEGFNRLGLTISPDLRGRVITSAAGAPTIIQALCLDSAEEALSADRNHVSEEDLKQAVAAYLKENGGRLADHYYRAIETTGPRRYRKQVLQAVAMAKNDYATMDDIRDGVSRSLDLDVPSTSLSGPLRDLRTAEYASILKDVDREVSGVRIHNLTAFTDPMMKSFVRFMNNLDHTDLMPLATPRSELGDPDGERSV